MKRLLLSLLALIVPVAFADDVLKLGTVYDLPVMYLSSPITSTTQVEPEITIAAPIRNGSALIIPSLSGAVFEIAFGGYTESVYASRVAVNSTTGVITLTGSVVRDLCYNQATSFTSCNNGRRWGKGAQVRLVDTAKRFNRLTDRTWSNVFNASGAIKFAGSGTIELPSYTSDTQRTQQTPTPNMYSISCLDSTGKCSIYSGGQWTEIATATGSFVNASDTVAGKIQIATLAAMQSLNGTGSTGAQNVVPLRWLVKNASGSLSAGRIPTLGSTGLLSQSVIPAQIGAGFFGDGSDGNVTISNATTLSRDMMYNNLTINTGAYINPGGFRIFVAGTLTLYGSTGSIVRNGNAGSNGTAASATTPGAGGASGAVLADSLLMGGIAGSMGGRGGLTVNNGDGAAGVAGNPGKLQGKAVGSNGVAGVAGGAGGQDDDSSGAVGSGGGAGAAGSVSAHPAAYGSFRFLFPATTNRLSTTTGSVVFYVNAGNGGSGGGGAGSCNGEGSDSAGAGGGGGGSGGNAGIVVVIANMIRGPGSIYAKGGNGGNGGNGGAASSTCGGGGGGASGSGGAGGLVVVVYGDTSWTGSTSVVGGSPGTPGSGGAGGTGAAAGSAGNTGNTGTSGISLTFALSQ